MKRPARLLALATLTAATAFAQETVVTRRGDGSVVIPTGEGDVTVTTRTRGLSLLDRIPPRGVRLAEKQLDRFLRDREGRDAGWT